MFKVYTLEEEQIWDRIVKSFKKYDTYYLSGYVKAFEIHGDGKPLLFYYQNEYVRGMNVVMLRDISQNKDFDTKIKKGKYFDIITPYGYGGWLIEGENSENLFETYERWCRENNIISEFVRFHPVIKNHKYCKKNYEIIELGEVITMDLTSREGIFENLSSKNRNMVRKAIKNNIKIYNGRFRDIFIKFKEIYDKTMDKDKADNYYYFDSKFYESILEDLPDNAQIFYAEYENKIIAASIILGTNGQLNYHLSGSEKEFSNLAPTNLLLYKVALWGFENGYKTFYLGGGVGSQEDSLFKFKKSFYRGENNYRFYIGKKIFNNEIYMMLIEKRKFDEEKKKNSFFPLYRQK